MWPTINGFIPDCVYRCKRNEFTVNKMEVMEFPADNRTTNATTLFGLFYPSTMYVKWYIIILSHAPNANTNT